jgi:hypothetical protein
MTEFIELARSRAATRSAAKCDITFRVGSNNPTLISGRDQRASFPLKEPRYLKWRFHSEAQLRISLFKAQVGRCSMVSQAHEGADNAGQPGSWGGGKASNSEPSDIPQVRHGTDSHVSDLNLSMRVSVFKQLSI